MTMFVRSVAIGLLLALPVYAQTPTPNTTQETGAAPAEATPDTLEALTDRAEKGSLAAQYNLGLVYHTGRGFAGAVKDEAKAIEWWKKAAAGGETHAQYALSIAYFEGIGVEKNPAEAIKWLKESTKVPNASAEFRLAQIYRIGLGSIAKDPVQAAEWTKKAAEHGHPEALYMMGMLAKDTGNLPEAIRAWEASAKAGNSDAQNALGSAYFDGIGVTKDFQKSTHWYELAAAKENINAQWFLGVAYHLGLGVEQDDAKALIWWVKAAEKGFSSAQQEVGNLYAAGVPGIAKNETEALKWWLLAAEKNMPDAQFQVGNAYKEGRLISQDKKKALEYWKKSATSGNANAAKQLADAYFNGDSITRDESEAMKWYRISANHGDIDSQMALARYFSKNGATPQQKMEAFFWYRDPAERAVAEAQLKMGEFYVSGIEPTPPPATEESTKEGAHKEKYGASEPPVADADLGLPPGFKASPAMLAQIKKFRERQLTMMRYRTESVESDKEGTIMLKTDIIKAYMWFDIAAGNGDTVALEKRDKLKGQLRSNQLIEAQRLAQEKRDKWLASPQP